MAKLLLRNNDQVALFKEELVGQLSDGAWENTTPHNHWKGWSDAELGVDVNNPGLVDGSQWNFPKRGYGFVKALVNDMEGSYDLTNRMRSYVVMYRLTGKLENLSAGEYLAAEGSYEKFVDVFEKRSKKEISDSIKWQREEDEKIEKAIHKIMNGDASDKKKDKYARLILDRTLENGSPYRPVVEKKPRNTYWTEKLNLVSKELADKFFPEFENYSKKDLLKDLRDIQKIMKIDVVYPGRPKIAA
jgi:hypothetical protein